MKRKLTALLIALVLASSLAPTALAHVPPPGEDYFTHHAYMQGYGDDTFRPHGNITRAEMVTLFFRILTDDYRERHWTTSNPFSDISQDDWYNNAVSVINRMGILSGYADGSFRPNAPVTRAEMSTIAATFALLENAPIYTDTTFSDISGHWAKEYIEIASSVGWVQGYDDGSFQPNAPITRAETTVMINRILHRAPETTADLLPNMLTWSDNANTSAWYYLDIQEATNSHYYERKDIPVPGSNFNYESWTKRIPNRDWSELEKPWSIPEYWLPPDSV